MKLPVGLALVLLVHTCLGLLRGCHGLRGYRPVTRFRRQMELAQGCHPSAGPPVRFPKEVNLDRVRRCRSSRPPCRSELTKPQYHHWADAGLNNHQQQQIFLTEVFTPAKNATKNLVLGVAGQQSVPSSSAITGQRASYRRHFSRTDATQRVKIDSSLVGRILREGFFPPEESFVGMVFDANFSFESTTLENDQAEQGYLDYLSSKLQVDTVENIYLVGHSRGGCLVLRLAPKLASRFPTARIIVHTLDPVCRKNHPSDPSRQEFGVSEPRVDNPATERKNWAVFTTDMTEEFRLVQRQCVAVRSFLSGQTIHDDNARGLGHRGFEDVQNSLRHDGAEDGSFFPFAWYMQSFHSQDHTNIQYFHRGEARMHLRYSMSYMPCPCGVPLSARTRENARR